MKMLILNMALDLSRFFARCYKGDIGDFGWQKYTLNGIEKAAERVGRMPWSVHMSMMRCEK